MNMMHSFLLIGAALSTGTAYAELYKSVGPDGKITYSDMPPPSASRIEKKAIASGGNVSPNLPYELAQAAAANPVTLYTSAKCSPCDEGRQLLQKRGIPFQEKTVSSAADAAKLKQATGAETGLPVLAIGRATQAGFDSTGWSSALTAAGYPAQNRLPSNYRQPVAEAAAPSAITKAKPAAETQEQAVTARVAPAVPKAGVPAGDAPPGFRF